MVDTLMKSGKQVVVTTHSMLLEDLWPSKAVRLIYKTTVAATQVADFSELPEAQKRLEVFGSGDALLDLSQRQVTEEVIRVLAKEQQEA